MEEFYTKPNTATKNEIKKQAISIFSREDLNDFISQDLAQFCATDLDRIVFNPLKKFTGNSSNQFRARLVELSISLCSDKALVFTKQFQKEISQKLSKFLEALHAGSLIIDDIQDGASHRRGKPSLHTEIGVPLAINSGSWLYFWALSLISKMELEPRIELEMTRLCHQTMLKGHLGQALDLGVRIDEVSQGQAQQLASSAMKLKTGTLMSLASELGAVACGVHPEVRLALKNFGLDFGYALQCYNDLGEFSTQHNQVSHDLILGRPTWIWVCASEHLTALEYQQFVGQVSLLRTSEKTQQLQIMAQLKTSSILKTAKIEAQRVMLRSYQNLSDHLLKYDYELNQRADWKELQLLGKKVMETYV